MAHPIPPPIVIRKPAPFKVLLQYADNPPEPADDEDIVMIAEQCLNLLAPSTGVEPISKAEGEALWERTVKSGCHLRRDVKEQTLRLHQVLGRAAPEWAMTAINQALGKEKDDATEASKDALARLRALRLLLGDILGTLPDGVLRIPRTFEGQVVSPDLWARVNELLPR
jgi:hypothetical protein